MDMDISPSWVEEYASASQTHAEEIINTITHGMGLMFSIPATIILVLLARLHGNKWHVIGCGIYGSSLILMYTCSTMYHGSGISTSFVELQSFLRDLDHCAIYFLIAGTYTPLTLINLVHNNLHATNLAKQKLDKKLAKMGCAVLAIVWTICVVGVSTKLIAGAEGVNPILSYGSYLLMGWMVLVVARPFFASLPRIGLRLLVAGGLSYTIGVIFLLSDFMPFNHPVWHLFVSAATILHYFAVIACSIPLAHTTSWKMMEKRTRSVILDWTTIFAL
jgi:hemolysin III